MEICIWLLERSWMGDDILKFTVIVMNPLIQSVWVTSIKLLHIYAHAPFFYKRIKWYHRVLNWEKYSYTAQFNCFGLPDLFSCIVNYQKDFSVLHNCFKVHLKSMQFQFDYSVGFSTIWNSREFRLIYIT